MPLPTFTHGRDADADDFRRLLLDHARRLLRRQPVGQYQRVHHLRLRRLVRDVSHARPSDPLLQQRTQQIAACVGVLRRGERDYGR